MKNFSFALRIGAGFGLLLVLMVAVALTGSWGVETQYQRVKNLVEGDIALNAAASDTRYHVGNLRRFEKDSFINLDKPEKVKEYQDKWNDSLAKAQDSLKKANALADDDEKKQIAELQSQMDKYAEGFQKVAGQLGQGLTTTADANKAMGDYKAFVHGMEEALNGLLKKTNEKAGNVTKELASARANTERALWIQAIVAVLIGMAVAAGVAISIRDPLNATQAAAQRIEAGNDLTVTLPEAGDNEVGRTISAFRRLFSGLRTLVRDARDGAKLVASSATEMDTISEQVAIASSNQAQASAAVASAIEELTTSIAVVADSADSVHKEASTAVQKADQGEKLAGKAAEEIGRIAEALDAAGESISALNARSDEIGGIVRVIKDIAEQTNLLALNAAIEAARAGEMGRGFAVVADEVRKLAERTAGATADISSKIDTVQRDTGQAHSRMQEASRRIDAGVACARELAGTMDSIRSGSKQTVETLTEISTAIREQRIASNQIALNVEQIAQMSEENHASVSSANVLAKRLGELSRGLNTQIGQFVVD